MRGLFQKILDYLEIDPWMVRERVALVGAKFGLPIARALACVLVAYLQFFLLVISPIGHDAEQGLRRAWYKLRGERELVAPVVMVRVDDETYLRVNLPSGSPFPRDVIADGIEQIAQAGAKMIFLDVLFRQTTTEEIDGRLRQALSEAPTVIGRALLKSPATGPDGTRTMRVNRLDPHPMFRDSATETMSLIVVGINEVVENISTADDKTLKGHAEVPFLSPLRNLVSADINSPGWRDLINYYGGPFTIPSISLNEVLDADAEVLEKYFKDKVVLIGFTTDISTGLTQPTEFYRTPNDMFRTPASGSRTFGVEVHATIAANLLEGSWLRRPAWEAEVFFAALLAFVVVFILLSRPPKQAVPIVLAVGALCLTGSYVAFSRFHYFIPAATFVLVLLPIVIGLRLALPAIWARSIRRGG